VQHNISLLFSSAVAVLKSAPPADVTRSNAVEVRLLSPARLPRNCMLQFG